MDDHAGGVDDRRSDPRSSRCSRSATRDLDVARRSCRLIETRRVAVGDACARSAVGRVRAAPQRGRSAPYCALERDDSGALPQLLDRRNDPEVRHARILAGYDRKLSMAVERRTQPLERFWPYAEHPEQPTAEELAALDPDLHAALFGPRNLPFSITLVFARFDGRRLRTRRRAGAERGRVSRGRLGRQLPPSGAVLSQRRAAAARSVPAGRPASRAPKC